VAIEARDAVGAKVSEAAAKAERGEKLLAEAGTELEPPEASAKAFEERCAADHAFAILSAIEPGSDVPAVSCAVTGAADNGTITAARMRLNAFQATADRLADGLAAAESKAPALAAPSKRSPPPSSISPRSAPRASLSLRAASSSRLSR